MIVKIYTLIDPITCKIRYIGRTKNSLNTRLIGHISKSKNNKTHKDCWINSLLKQGTIPKIKLIKLVEGWRESHKYEQSLINKAVVNGFNLTNADDRGEGSVNKIVTDIQKLKISNTLKYKYNKGIIKPTRTIKVCTFNLNGNFIKQYNSGKECCLDIKIPQSSLENILSKRVRRWRNYQITYGEDPGKYIINKKDMSFLNKKVYLYKNNQYLEFESYKSVAKFLKVSSPTIRRYIESGLVYKNYIITNARIKQGELLENPTRLEDNQQPSLISNNFEGSTTNSQIQTSNVEDGNANKSALPTKNSGDDIV